MTGLDRSNVQSLILAPYQLPIARHLLFEICAKDGGRRFLAHWLSSIACGDQDPSKYESLLNVALSWNGLKALGAFDQMGGDAVAAKAFYIFKENPDPESLRVAGTSSPAHWWNGRFDGSRIHLVLHIHVKTDDELDALTGRIRASAIDCGLIELNMADADAITGRQIDGRRLHFGYQDGISHPAVNWDDDEHRPGLLPRGDFLLGYPGNYATYPDKPPFGDFVRDGSLAAFMLMYQDVAGFNRFLRDNGPIAAPALSQADAEEYLAAKLMGRWRDGSPLMLSPDGPEAGTAMADDFGYAGDPNGLICPVGAHIRLANSRDQPLNALNKNLFPAGFPRVLRRGSPYGPALEGCNDDGIDRGIVGMFLCANLNKQFYTITRWFGRTDFSPVFKDPVGQDPIVGNKAFSGASAAFEIPEGNGRPSTILQIPDFVRLKGVAFLLLPSMSALRSLTS